ncbi:MAG TPA: cytidylate kinase-like family protein [Spirochaetota bacterium]|nr:cytidylate kinase-like family protein [Spirochaetota bacterium]
MGYHSASMMMYIDAQVKFWKNQKDAIDQVEVKEKTRAASGQKPFVTISRQYGAGAYEVGEKLVTLMNERLKPEHAWAAYDRKLLDKLEKDLGLSESLAGTLTENARAKLTDLLQTNFSKFPPQVAVYRKLVENIRTLASNGNVVIIGRAGNIITEDMANGFHVRVVAPLHQRVERMSKILSVRYEEAKQIVMERDQKRDSFISEYVKHDNTDPLNYNLVLNMGKLSVDEAAEIIAASMKIYSML